MAKVYAYNSKLLLLHQKTNTQTNSKRNVIKSNQIPQPITCSTTVHLASAFCANGEYLLIGFFNQQ